MKIYKYRLEFVNSQKILLPVNRRVSDAQIQNGMIMLWVLVDCSENARAENVEFKIFGTEDEISPCTPIKHISTIQDDDLVWHVFEILT